MAAVDQAERLSGSMESAALSVDRPAIAPGFIGLILAGLFAVALVCRVGGLAGAVTEDEDQWLARAGNFAAALTSGERGRTYQTGHPGVVPMWLVTASLGLEGTAELSSRGRTDFVVTTLPQFLSDLRQARVPFALLGALLCAGLAGLTWRLLGAGPGLVAGALLATDPYWSAMSPVVGMDGLLAGFLGISLLAVLLARGEPRHAGLWIACSGIACGLAALTKTSAAYMLPGLAALALAERFTKVGALPLPRGDGWGEGLAKGDIRPPSPRPSPRGRGSRSWGEPALLIGIWLIAAAVVYYTLWPSMWTQPVGTLVRTLDFSARLGGAPHAPGNFLLGNTAEDPGPLFYPVAMAFRLGPATTLGLLCLLAFGAARRLTRVTWLVLIAAGVFLLLITVSPKKVDRYIMPLVPLLTIVAAIGWWSGLQWLARFWSGVRQRSGLAVVALSVVIGLIQVWPLAVAGKYPLSAYNPLFGGARTAEQAIPVGWGEGLDEAAAIIQTMAGGVPVTTSIWFPLRVNFQAHLPGPVVTERQINQADYFVDYVHARQRLHTPPQLQRRPPDAIVNIAGVDYARIYRLR